MTSVDIQKTRFNQLVAKCFEESALSQINVKDVVLHKASQTYYVTFTTQKIFTLAEEATINRKKNAVFTGGQKVKFFFDYPE